MVEGKTYRPEAESLPEKGRYWTNLILDRQGDILKDGPLIRRGDSWETEVVKGGQKGRAG